MKTAFLITVRLKSTRLPGKALLDLQGRPVLGHLIDRLRLARRLDTIVVCTSTDSQDDPLAEFAAREGVGCFRGDPDDVLKRLHDAGRAAGADYLLNITADCPLVDPVYADRIVEAFERTGADLIRALDLPHGAFSYGLKPGALDRVMAMKNEVNTEVWGGYFTDTDQFTVVDLDIEPRHRRPDLRLTLDYPEDLEVLQRVLAGVPADGGAVSLDAVIAFLDAHPEVSSLNRACADRYRRRWMAQGAVKLKPRYEVKRAAIVGCGSIGQRHVRNLRALGVTDIVALRGHPGHTRPLDPVLGVREVESWEAIADAKPDIAIVSNPSSLHVATALRLLPMVRGLFIEKPVSLSAGELAPLLTEARSARVTTFVGHVLACHPIIELMRSRLQSGDLGEPLVLQAQAGQYLPDWHPYEDYRQVYYARPELGGGVLRSLIHEPHLAIWLLGPPARVAAIARRAPGLDADVDGLDDLMIEHQGGAVSQIHLDYLQQPARRTGILVCARGVLQYDLVGGSLVEQSAAATATLWSDPAFDMNRVFVNQMSLFLRYVREGRVRHEHDASRAASSVALVDAALAAAKTDRFEPVAEGGAVMTALFDLTGKTALVVGGRGFLGRRFSLALADAGATVHAADLGTISRAAKADLTAAPDDDRIVQHDCDVTDASSVDACVAAVAAGGPIDTLVYAVTAKPRDFYQPFTESSLEGWRTILSAELDGLFLTAQRVGREMEKARAGNMVFLSSIYGVVGNDQRIYEGSNLPSLYAGVAPGTRQYAHAGYATAKGGVIALTRFLAAYWGDAGIRVNCVSPGGIGHAGENETFIRQYSNRVPMGRKALPDEVNGAVVFLSSGASSYMTGQNLIVDGGWTAW